MRYAHHILRFGPLIRTSLQTIGLCAGVMLVGWSCQRRSEPAPELLEDMALDVAPSFASLENPSNSAPRSKATFESFNAGDLVGLYVVYRAPGDVARPLSGVAADSSNLRYTANSAGVLTRILPDKPVYYNKLNPNKVDLYGYFPFNSALTNAQLGAYEFTIAKDQSAVGALAASDLCWAKNEKGVEADPVVPSAKPVEMHFKHRCSKITVTINVPKTLSGNRTVTGLSGVKLHGILPTTVLNMSTGVVALPNEAAKKVPTAIIPLAGVAKEENNLWWKWQFEAIIPPQTMVAGTAVVAFQVETSGVAEQLVLYAPSNLFGTHLLTCQSGVQYEWTLIVGSSSGSGGGGSGEGQIEVKLDGSTIKAWQTGTPVSGDLTNSITTRFSFTNAAIDATVNRVKVTTNESATVYDIATGVTVDEATQTCSFSFTRASSSPRDYGFSITKLEFLNNTTSVHTWTGTSARVYNPTSMTL